MGNTMDLYLLSILFFFLSNGNAQRFQNPVLDGGDFPDPGVLLHQGIYYAVTTTNNDKIEKFPIHTSSDLQNWSKIGYVINETNFPVWSRINDDFWAPEMHKVGDNFHVYFSARDVESDLLGIGVAISSSPMGPFKTQENALLVVPGMWVVDSTLIKHDNRLILAWVGNRFIRMRYLNDDGLSFADDNIVAIFEPTLEWEGETTEGPWYIYRNGYHYIFYSGNDFCTDRYGLGVARSNVSVFGPYEKRGPPLLMSEEIFKGPGHGSIVRDIDGIGWVFVHHGWKAGAICGDNYRLMFSSTLTWGDDDWPKNMTIGD